MRSPSGRILRCIASSGPRVCETSHRPSRLPLASSHPGQSPHLHASQEEAERKEAEEMARLAAEKAAKAISHIFRHFVFAR